MSKLPNPPRDLARISPELLRLPAGTELWRLYKRGGRHPVSWNTFRTFGPLKTSRFDHHLPDKGGGPRLQDRGIYYAAAEIDTCLAELFQDTRTIDRESEEVTLVGFELRQAVELLDLTGTWPTQAGASMVLSSGPRSRSRLWSCAIYEAYPDIQGLYYPSSMMANRPVIALYERAMSALAPVPLVHRPLSDPALLPDLDRSAQRLGYRLV
ncbi:MAG: RES family NAD+ phosphorylase [Thermoanaerobaculia bacterium]